MEDKIWPCEHIKGTLNEWSYATGLIATKVMFCEFCGAKRPPEKNDELAEMLHLTLLNELGFDKRRIAVECLEGNIRRWIENKLPPKIARVPNAAYRDFQQGYDKGVEDVKKALGLDE